MVRIDEDWRRSKIDAASPNSSQECQRLLLNGGVILLVHPKLATDITHKMLQDAPCHCQPETDKRPDQFVRHRQPTQTPFHNQGLVILGGMPIGTSDQCMIAEQHHSKRTSYPCEAARLTET